MLFDYQSLLLAIGCSGGALGLTLLAAWLQQRSDRFLLTWAIGTFLLVASVAGFNLYGRFTHPLVGFTAFSLLTFGFAVLLGAAEQFSNGKSPLPLIFGTGVPALLLIAVGFGSGYSGAGAIASNLAGGLLLFATAAKFWSCRREAPGAILGLSLSYSAAGLSFVLCALVLLLERRFILDGPPRNWAEDLNAFVSIIGMTGIGAITIALNQYRLARRHQSDAQTDSMTGLLNRRALFELYGELDPDTAVIIFDLDNFKSVNDEHGHSTGDKLLARFASCLIHTLPPEAQGARLGGEEFAVVLPSASLDAAIFVAERVRLDFAGETLVTPLGPLRRTVSAGVAVAGALGGTLDMVLRQADDALYLAKREGRDRVRSETRLVA